MLEETIARAQEVLVRSDKAIEQGERALQRADAYLIKQRDKFKNKADHHRNIARSMVDNANKVPLDQHRKLQSYSSLALANYEAARDYDAKVQRIDASLNRRSSNED